MLLLLCNGQPHGNRQAAALRFLRPNRAVQRFDNLLGNRQSQTAALLYVRTGRIGTIKAVEQFRQAFGRHAGAVVDKGNDDGLAILGNDDVYVGLRRRLIFYAVRQQVFHDSPKLVPVYSDGRRALMSLERQRHALLGQHHSCLADDVFKIPVYRYDFQRKGNASQIQLGKQEQAVYEPLHSAGRVVNFIDILALLFRRPGNALANTAGIALQQRKRRRQIMRNTGDKFLAVLLILLPLFPHLPQLLAHVVKIAARLAQFILRRHDEGIFEVPFLNFRRCPPQFCQRLDNLPRQEARQVQSQPDDDDDGKDEDSKQHDFQYILQGVASIVRRDKGHVPGRPYDRVAAGRRINKGKVLVIPRHGRGSVSALHLD